MKFGKNLVLVSKKSFKGVNGSMTDGSGIASNHNSSFWAYGLGELKKKDDQLAD